VPVPQEHLVIVGSIIKPHGVKGEVAVEIYGDSSDFFFSGRRFLLKRKNHSDKFMEIDTVRCHKERALIFFKGIDNRDAAEGLRHFDLLIDKDDLPSLVSDEYYHFEILEARVQDVDGKFVGKVRSVLETGASSVLEIQTPKMTFLLPFVEEYVLKVDRRKREIVIRNFHELMDLGM